MILEEQVRRLQNLLERVQRNGALSRVAARPAEASAGANSVEVDLLEEDIEEIAAVEMEEASAASDVSHDFDIDFDDEPESEEEEAPASSRRQRAPTSMDEALAGAVEQEYRDNYGHEAPLHTPPPESGPQQAVAPAAASPTPEQIGDTVALEESSGPALELDTLPQHEPEAIPVAEELEVVLPSRAPAGAYDESLTPPPVRVETHEAPQMVVLRPPVSGTHAASFEGERTQQNPSFAALLDESLSLGS